MPHILKRICYEVQTLISYKAYEKAPYRCLHDIDMVLFKKKERGEKGGEKENGVSIIDVIDPL